MIKITGNTYPARELLDRCGFVFDKKQSAYIGDENAKKELDRRSAPSFGRINSKLISQLKIESIEPENFKRQDPPEIQDELRKMMGNLTDAEIENIAKEHGREYFTAILNGKEIKCWLYAKEFIPDLKGDLYTEGYCWDGEKHHTIRVYLKD